MKSYTRLGDIKAYRISSELSDYIWDEVMKWDWFSKKTVGAQLVEAIDSIAANIAEGFGRYHKKDKIKFYYNSRGSVYESIFWVEKSYKRKLINDETYKKLSDQLSALPKEINILIKLTNKYLTI